MVFRITLLQLQWMMPVNIPQLSIELSQISCIIGATAHGKDAPVECSRKIFSLWKTIWNDYILSGPQILGAVKHHAVRYEVQGRQSLHVHIVLWLKTQAEVTQTDRNIWAFIPAECSEETQSFVQPHDPLRQRLLRNIALMF
jgi:hypothetical protein